MSPQVSPKLPKATCHPYRYSYQAHLAEYKRAVRREQRRIAATCHIVATCHVSSVVGSYLEWHGDLLAKLHGDLLEVTRGLTQIYTGTYLADAAFE